MIRAVITLSVTLALAVTAVLAISGLQSQATAARDDESRVTQLQLDIARAQFIPWGASPDDGGAVDATRGELKDAEQGINLALTKLVAGGELHRAATIRDAWKRSDAALWQIFTASANGDEEGTGEPSEIAAVQAARADEALAKAGARYRANAARALRTARVGTAAAIALLFLAFAAFLLLATRARRRAEALTVEKRRLLAVSQQEAITDALTGLRNRRALNADLAVAEPAAEGEQVMLALYDLDGFKQYNDTFGHPAGDSLLVRLGERLATTMQGVGTAYRMGGDEFCVLASVCAGGEDAIARLAASALSDDGVGFTIGCSYGVTLLPRDANEASDALRIADQNMYAQKTSRRSSAGRQSADVLVRLLKERSDQLGGSVEDVAYLAARTAQRLELPEVEVSRIRLAAELHDVGKAAVPDAILDKPGALTDDEWLFIRRHATIGERVLLAAPSLSHTAPLVRSSHERVDGGGYPDGLAGDAIPLGARIIAVCNAFDAMITERPYRRPRSIEAALAELRACAGTQFDAQVVAAFAAVLAQREETVGA